MGEDDRGRRHADDRFGASGQVRCSLDRTVPLLGGYGEPLPALYDGRADVALLMTPFVGRRGADHRAAPGGPGRVGPAGRAHQPAARRPGRSASFLRNASQERNTEATFRISRAAGGLADLQFDRGGQHGLVPARLARRTLCPAWHRVPSGGRFGAATLAVGWLARSRSAVVRTAQQIAHGAAPYDDPLSLLHPARRRTRQGGSQEWVTGVVTAGCRDGLEVVPWTDHVCPAEVRTQHRSRAGLGRSGPVHGHVTIADWWMTSTLSAARRVRERTVWR